MLNYEVIENWDIGRIQKLAPKMDAPVIILEYKGIPCSVHGSPLIKTDDGLEEAFRKKGQIYNYQKYERFRSNKGHILRINYEGNDGKKNRYLVAVRDLEGTIDPIVEVTNGGRCDLRCHQWSRMLELAHQEGKDEISMGPYQYHQYLSILSKRLLV